VTQLDVNYNTYVRLLSVTQLNVNYKTYVRLLSVTQLNVNNKTYVRLLSVTQLNVNYKTYVCLLSVTYMTFVFIFYDKPLQIYMLPLLYTYTSILRSCLNRILAADVIMSSSTRCRLFMKNCFLRT